MGKKGRGKKGREEVRTGMEGEWKGKARQGKVEKKGKGRGGENGRVEKEVKLVATLNTPVSNRTAL